MAWYWPFKRAADDSATPAPAEPVTKALPASGLSGIGGFTPSTPPPPETKPAGADGSTIIGGFVVSRERSPALTGVNKWITYDNQVLNIAIIAAAVNIWTKLAGSAKWTVEPNKRGGSDAEKAADIVTQGLLEAQLSTPWRQVVRRQVMKIFRGFSMHEVILRRRSDDMIVVGDIQERPQWTIWRWNRPDPQAGWIGVEQMTETSGAGPWYIPRERLFYSVENTLSASPEGVGLLRQTAEPARVFELYRRFEGIGLQTDLRGIPQAMAPLQELVQQARDQGNATDAEIQAFVRRATSDLISFLANHNKDERQGILLDSALFKDNNGNPTGARQWGFDLVKGAASSLGDVNTAIGRETRDIARIMCAEWLLLGGEDSGGAYSMHEDKTAMFGLCVNSALEDVADDATRDIATRLVAMNGLDPETCTPKLVPEPIATGAVLAACQALMAMTQAALDPRDKAINVLRGRLNLPPAPGVDESMLVLPHGDTVEQLGPDGKPIGGGGGRAQRGPQPQQPAGDGEAGNPNARPEAADGQLAKYAPEQPRDEDGRFAGGGGGAPRAWTRAFDARDHMRQIEEHRFAEANAKAKAARLQTKIDEAKLAGRSTPALERRRNEHVAAAKEAATARRQIQADLDAKRTAHAAGLRADSQARQDAQWERARAEAESMMAIGQHRIGGSEGVPEVTPSAGLDQPKHVTEAEARVAAMNAEQERARQSAALQDRDLRERLGVGKPLGTAVDTPAPRQVVHYADTGPKTLEEWAAHDNEQRRRVQESNDRMRARNEALRPTEPAHGTETAGAHTHAPRPGLLGRLRGLLSHKSADPVFMKMLEDAADELEIYEVEQGDDVAKFDIDQPRDAGGRWSGGSGGSRDIGEDDAQAHTAASAEAWNATQAAQDAYGTPAHAELNAKAAELHDKAGDAHTAAGDGDTAYEHYEMARRHRGGI